MSHGDHPLTGPLLTRPAPVPAPAMVPAMVPAVPAVPDSPSSPTIATAPAVPVAAPAVPSVLSSGLRTERQERFAGGGSTGTAGTAGTAAGSAAGSAAGAATARVDPREVFANGAARFAGGGADGGLHGLHTLSPNGFAGGSSRGGSDGSGSLGVFPGALPGESGGSVPMFGAGSALPGDSRKTWEPLPPKTLWSDPLQGTWRDQHVFASGMETKPKAENTAGNTAGNTPSGKTPDDDDDDETYSVDCGTTVFQPKDWHFTFRPPNTGDFNIPIAVHQSPHQKSYQIARMEVSVNADLDNWQPFQLLKPGFTCFLSYHRISNMFIYVLICLICLIADILGFQAFHFCQMSDCQVAFDRPIAHLDSAEGVGHLGVRGSPLRVYGAQLVPQLHPAQGTAVGLRRGVRVGHVDGGLRRQGRPQANWFDGLGRAQNHLELRTTHRIVKIMYQHEKCIRYVM